MAMYGFLPHDGDHPVYKGACAAAQTWVTGDPLVEATGRLELATATTQKIKGVAASNVTASTADDEALFWPVEHGLFMCGYGGANAIAATDRGTQCDFTAAFTSGIATIDKTATTYKQVEIVDLIDAAAVTNGRVLVKFRFPEELAIDDVILSGQTVSALTTSGAIAAGTTLAAGSTVTAATGVTATTGGVTAAAGDITATLGDLVSAAGAVSAATTVTAGTGVVATTGGVEAVAGGLTATLGGLTVVAGGAAIAGGVVLGDYQAKSGAYTMLLTDFACYATATSAYDITLPGGAPAGTIMCVYKDNAAANAIGVVPASGLINGAANISLASGAIHAVIAISDGTNWLSLALF